MQEILKPPIPAELIRTMAVIFAQEGLFDERIEKVTEELTTKNPEAMQRILAAWEGYE